MARYNLLHFVRFAKGWCSVYSYLGSRCVYRGILLTSGLLPFFPFCKYIEYALILLLLLLMLFLVRHILRRERGPAMTVPHSGMQY
jgi:hypothetical protein